jgi:hypothetical protein
MKQFIGDWAKFGVPEPRICRVNLIWDCREHGRFYESKVEHESKIKSQRARD